ncbi:MAG: FecR domain-containing protein [Alphaproteobacteria bacterium]|nr:FecR domain-containing protein [Alphaproteobacteria bacterium]MBV9375974.1 FecR domain-containing protein [Alphaproteobacteria bacterium]
MKSVWSVAAAIVCVAGLSARADEAPVGFVKTLAGTATVIHGAVSNAAALGMPVYDQDRLETGGDGELGVTFRDNTRISLGPDSRLELKRFVFKPEVEEYGLILRVAYGTLEYISGLTEKLAPNAMSIETPGFTVGARGTRLLVRAAKRQ